MYIAYFFKERQTAELVEVTNLFPETRICSGYKIILNIWTLFSKR